MGVYFKSKKLQKVLMNMQHSYTSKQQRRIRTFNNFPGASDKDINPSMYDYCSSSIINSITDVSITN